MSVRTLVGTADGTNPAAALYDSVTGQMLGFIFEHETHAVDHAESFLAWVEGGRAKYVARQHLIPHPIASHDFRAWTTDSLRQLLPIWRSELLDPDGIPNDTTEGVIV